MWPGLSGENILTFFVIHFVDIGLQAAALIVSHWRLLIKRMCLITKTLLEERGIPVNDLPIAEISKFTDTLEFN